MEYNRVIFVFGSNLAGRHGKGAARHALEKWGAVYGRGRGLQGDSYAIPTKDEDLRVRTLDQIEEELATFNRLVWRDGADKWLFILTPIGCGLAGYKREQIRVLLERFEWPPNVVLTLSWFERGLKP